MFAHADFAAIAALDFARIKTKLRHAESGEGWTSAHVDAVEQEYRRFLYLMKTYPLEQTVPSVDVDTFWHYHILDTVQYASDCQRVFGHFLHHDPNVGLDGASEEPERQRRAARMRALYSMSFGHLPATGLAADESSCSNAAPRRGSAPGEPAYCGIAAAEPAYCGIAAKAAYCGIAAAEPAYCGIAAKAAYCGIASAEPAYCGVAAKTAYCGIARAEPAHRGNAAANAAYCGIAAAKPAYCGIAAAKPAYCGIAATKAAYCGIAATKAAYCGIANVQPAYCGIATVKVALSHDTADVEQFSRGAS